MPCVELSIFPYFSLNVCFVHFKSLLLGEGTFITVKSFWWTDLLIIMECPFSLLVILFGLESTLFVTNRATPASFCSLLHSWSLSIYLLSTCLYLYLLSVSLWETYNTVFLFEIYSVHLCLLSGTFRPLRLSTISHLVAILRVINSLTFLICPSCHIEHSFAVRSCQHTEEGWVLKRCREGLDNVSFRGSKEKKGRVFWFLSFVCLFVVVWGKQWC